MELTFEMRLRTNSREEWRTSEVLVRSPPSSRDPRRSEPSLVLAREGARTVHSTWRETVANRAYQHITISLESWWLVAVRSMYVNARVRVKYICNMVTSDGANWASSLPTSPCDRPGTTAVSEARTGNRRERWRGKIVTEWGARVGRVLDLFGLTLFPLDQVSIVGFLLSLLARLLTHSSSQTGIAHPDHHVTLSALTGWQHGMD